MRALGVLIGVMMLACLAGAAAAQEVIPEIEQVSSMQPPECFPSGDEFEYTIEVENIGDEEGEIFVVPECTAPFRGEESDYWSVEPGENENFDVVITADSAADATGTCTFVARAADDSSSYDEWPITVCVKGTGSSGTGTQPPAQQPTTPSTQQPSTTSKPSTGGTGGGCLGAIILGGILLASASRR